MQQYDRHACHEHRGHGHPSGGPGTLTGAGSTFVAPFYALAFSKYHQQHPAVTVNYAVVGSSAGIAAISAKQVNFGASDVPMNASELAAAKGGPSPRCPTRWPPKASPTTSASRRAPGCT